MRSYYRSQRRFYAKKEEDISVIKDKEREITGICKGLVEEGIYQAIKITTNITSVLCIKEEWEEEDNVKLQISEQLDNQKQLFITIDLRSNK